MLLLVLQSCEAMLGAGETPFVVIQPSAEPRLQEIEAAAERVQNGAKGLLVILVQNLHVPPQFGGRLGAFLPYRREPLEKLLPRPIPRELLPKCGPQLLAGRITRELLPQLVSRDHRSGECSIVRAARVPAENRGRRNPN